MGQSIGVKIYGYTWQGDLLDRALSLGYTGDSAARLADCAVNWDNVTDACVKHPGHSTTMRDGYTVDDCEACEVIRMTDDAGWVPAVKPTVVKVVTVHFNDGATKPPCGRGANMDSDPAKTTCRKCKNTRRYALANRSGVEILAGLLSLDGGKTPARVVKATPTCHHCGRATIGRDDQTAPFPHECVSTADLVKFGLMKVAPVVAFPTDTCYYAADQAAMLAKTSHLYCVGPCTVRDRMEASDRAARTTVETGQQCADRIKRGKYRAGDMFPFRVEGVAGVRVERIVEVINWVSGGLDVRGHLGGYSMIRPDRLD